MDTDNCLPGSWKRRRTSSLMSDVQTVRKKIRTVSPKISKIQKIKTARTEKSTWDHSEHGIYIPTLKTKVCLKKKVLCPCLFPHCLLMQELHGKLLHGKNNIPPRNKDQALLDEIECIKEMNPNTAIELIFNCDDILRLIEEKTNGKGHMKNCSSQAEPSMTVFLFALSEKDARTFTMNLEMVELEMKYLATFPDIFYAGFYIEGRGIKNDAFECVLSERSFEIQKSGKSMRTYLSFLIEKPIKQSLVKLRSRIEKIKERKIQLAFKDLPLGPNTRKVSQMISEKGDVETFRQRDPKNFAEISEPYNYILDRIISLENELIRIPSEPRQVIDGLAKNEIPEALTEQFSKMKEVVAFGHNLDMLEVWIDADLVSQEGKKKLLKMVNTPCKIRFVKYTPAMKEIKPGDELYRICHGTVGMFAKSEKDLIGITIAHLHIGMEELYVASDAISEEHEIRQKELGKVIKLKESGTSPTEGVSFIRVHDSEIHRIQLQLERNGILLDSHLYTADDNLAKKRQQVFKKGARTGWTEGIVKFAGNPLPDTLIIEGNNGEFSKEGDSGSVIIRWKPNDPDGTVEIISVLSGYYKDRQNREISGTLTYALKKPLEMLSKERKSEYTLR